MPMSMGSKVTPPSTMQLLEGMDALTFGTGDSLLAIDKSLTLGFQPQAGVFSTDGDGRVDPTELIGDVAVIHMVGVLMKDARYGYYTRQRPATLPELEQAVDRAANDPKVSGIVVRADSPGGTVAGTAAVADAVARARAIKPVATVAPDLMASAMFWIGSQAGRVFVGKTAKVGSIGTYAVIPDLSKMFQDFGWQMHVVREGEFKGAAEPGTAVTEKHLGEFGRLIKSLNEHFLEGVASSGLGLSMADAKRLNTGQVWVGREAVSVGVAHEVGGLDEAIAWVRSHASGFTGGVAGGRANRTVAAGGVSSGPGRAQSQGERSMKINAKQRTFLEGLGLAKGANDTLVQAFVDGLNAEQRAKFDGLAEGGSEGEAGGGSGGGQASGGSSEDDDEDDEPAPAGGGSASSGASGGNSNANGGAMTMEQVSAASQQAVAQALAADRQRASTIRETGRSVRMSEALIEQHVSAGTSVSEFQQVALANASARLGPIDGLGAGGFGGDGSGGRISMGADRNRDTIEQAIEDAVFARMGIAPIVADELGYVLVDADGRVQTRQPSERARQFGGRSLGEMSRAFFSALGATSLASMPMQQVCQTAFDRSRLVQVMGAAGSHSTSDFPAILANVANKTLRKAYLEARVLWPRFCRRATSPDFKTINRTQLGELPKLREVGELERISEVSVGDAVETYFLKVFADIFGVSWQTMVNDDLDALNRIPRMMGNAAMRSRDILSFNVLTTNPLMRDGKALFHADHGNLAAGGDVGAPSVATLNAMAAAMGTQGGLESDDDDTVILELEARGLIVPRALEGTTKELLNSTNKPGANNNTTNIWQGELEQVTSGRLDSNSTTAWYGFADNNEIDTIEMGFLEGMTQPMVTQEDGFDVLGRRYRVVDVAEAKAIDWRGLYKNPGS